MRNIYFVEFGTYNPDFAESSAVDNVIFPVETSGILDMSTAEERLNHLKKILHKNCVVSITDGVVSGEFDKIYNLETGTLHNYDVTYVLIRVVDREISRVNFPTFEQARKKMIEEVLEDLPKDEMTNYYVNRDADGNCDEDYWGIQPAHAWSDYVDGYGNGDWRIIVC